MHELPVTQGIIDVVLDATRRNGGRRIKSIDIVIGDLASIVDDSVQFYFDILGKDTLAEGAQLRFQRRAATATCLACQHSFSTRAPLTPVCPECGSAQLQVTGGREFYVESIEVSDEDSRSAADSERQRSDSV
jgi:hydrogenase nickel incorporation protein HypA/HybF